MHCGFCSHSTSTSQCFYLKQLHTFSTNADIPISIFKVANSIELPRNLEARFVPLRKVKKAFALFMKKKAAQQAAKLAPIIAAQKKEAKGELTTQHSF